jgi:hypothetical protein
LSGNRGFGEALGDCVGIQDDLIVVCGYGFKYGGRVVVVVDVGGDAEGENFRAAQDGAAPEKLGAAAVEGTAGEEGFLEDLLVMLGIY